MGRHDALARLLLGGPTLRGSVDQQRSARARSRVNARASAIARGPAALQAQDGAAGVVDDVGRERCDTGVPARYRMGSRT
jgi:hypothetical protein